MTSLTGTTAQTLRGTIDPPPFGAAIAGAVVQISTLGWVWSQTSAAECIAQPVTCLLDLAPADPWGRQVVLTVTGALVIWLVSLLALLRGHAHSDPSIVDRLWSIQPVVYCWHFYFSAPSPRLLLMSLLVSAWGARLTWNFAIKGGFSGGEDYRWVEIRKWFPGDSQVS
eukprot:TRINITY_DN8966_c0_g2_i10.p1 TRINITY_DN8966_c0_g2~~TRINITY_DN8966_c0_g2_i10.p1  ORF type:complete len:169 (+),score=32.47 TRINITY_DN8966_c0_g2_i10:96-602(+)